jgi:hypothetical protein
LINNRRQVDYVLLEYAEKENKLLLVSVISGLVSYSLCPG